MTNLEVFKLSLVSCKTYDGRYSKSFLMISKVAHEKAIANMKGHE